MAPLLSSLLALATLGYSTVIPKGSLSIRDVTSCPGYSASNVEVTDSGLTADLKLAGEACDVYGEDLNDLVIEVTYETGAQPASSIVYGLRC